MPAGRPSRYKPEMDQQAMEYMKQGASHFEVAYELGIALRTFENWCQKDGPHYKPSFAEAVNEGRSFIKGWWMKQARVKLHDPTFNHVLWYMNMKNRFDWCDKPRDMTGKPPVVVNIDTKNDD